VITARQALLRWLMTRPVPSAITAHQTMLCQTMLCQAMLRRAMARPAAAA